MTQNFSRGLHPTLNQCEEDNIMAFNVDKLHPQTATRPKCFFIFLFYQPLYTLIQSVKEPDGHPLNATNVPSSCTTPKLQIRLALNSLTKPAGSICEHVPYHGILILYDSMTHHLHHKHPYCFWFSDLELTACLRLDSDYSGFPLPLLVTFVKFPSLYYHLCFC